MKRTYIVFFILIACYSECTHADKQKKLEDTLSAVTRQLMLQQFFNEQRVRSEGQSGIKIIRQRRSGTKNYFTETHSGFSAASIHDHSNNIRSIGMGELTAVLNGIEFRTRHNDYRLYMPSRTSKKYHAVEPVPFPDVPPAVKNKTSVPEQIAEMREWFKAWRDQDYSRRDYRKYFKPLLCYLEGAWTNSGNKIDEPFSSDRHFIDAKSWQELHEKVRYVAYSGTKSRNENLSFLPTKIMKIINNTIPEFAQWNYRILCHPLKNDLPLNRLRVVEDLSSRMMTSRNIHQHVQSRAARFQLNIKDSDKFYDRPLGRGLLDNLMEEIPGKDNYPGHLTDKGLDGAALNPDKSTKDASRYHRWFTIPGRDAMGVANIHRGYNDEFMFAAMTTQPKVANIDLKKCGKYNKQLGKKPCWLQRQKWSYSIPLEVIYLTPLSTWNPYNITYHGNHKKHRKVTQKDGRNGKCSLGKALNGTTSNLYYRTPAEFFSGAKLNKDSADTDRGVTCVLDQQGKARKVRASGIYIFLPNIKGVGILRQRYPIFPVHGEGSSVWKELNALREIVMDPLNWKYMFWNSADINSSHGNKEIEMGLSRSKSTSRHTHKIELTADEVKQLKRGERLTKETSLVSGHQHTLVIRWNNRKNNYYYQKCDRKNICWDRHDKFFKQS